LIAGDDAPFQKLLRQFLARLSRVEVIHEFHPVTRVVIIASDDSEAVANTCWAQGAHGFICQSRCSSDRPRRIAQALLASGLPEAREIEGSLRSRRLRPS
jgi:DNA-binding NarL/FixJ family response regulator